MEMLSTSLHDIRIDMSIKVNFLHCLEDKFLGDCSDVSDEQEERFQQDIKKIEERYQGRWDKRMMVDYWWSIKRDLNNAKHDRQPRKRKCLP